MIEIGPNLRDAIEALAIAAGFSLYFWTRAQASSKVHTLINASQTGRLTMDEKGDIVSREWATEGTEHGPASTHRAPERGGVSRQDLSEHDQISAGTQGGFLAREQTKRP